MVQQHKIKIRDTAAGLIKSLILARAAQEANFLSPHELERWGVAHVNKDPRPCDRYLDRVSQLRDRFVRDFLTDQDSIPSPNLAEEADELDTLLDLVATFIVGDLSEAARNARDGKKIGWAELARWDELGVIRDALDRLPRGDKGPQKRNRPFKSGGEPTESEDGPQHPNGFAFRSTIHRGLNGVAFRLIDVLWTAKGNSIDVDKHAESVWQDHSMRISSGQLGGARARANHFFEVNDLPFKVATSGRRATLLRTSE